MPDVDLLWDEVYEALKYHQPDGNWQALFDRQMNKYGREAGEVNPSTCDITEEMLTLEQLDKEIEKKTPMRTPACMKSP